MKTKPILLIATCISMLSISCKEASNTQKQEADQEIQQEISEEKKNDSYLISEEANYTITEYQVGHLSDDKEIITLNPGETFSSEMITMEEEGNEYDVLFQYVLNEKNDTLIIINDYGYWVYSPDYSTESGISTNSNVSDFFEAYPDAKIEYSYISDLYWLRTESLDGIEFIIPADAFFGDENSLLLSDLAEVNPEQVDMKARIQKIRVY